MDLIYENHFLFTQKKKHFQFAFKCHKLKNKMWSHWNWDYLQIFKNWINDFLIWVKKDLIVLNLLLKPSKEIWKIIEGIHQHDHFIRGKKCITFPFQLLLIKDQISVKKKVCPTQTSWVGADLILHFTFRMTSTAVRIIFDVTKSGKIKVKS